ncbi:MAG: HNH endonuclease [Chitinophagales bacterium]|nr:HNH endonuclease [Chitinophagales bacterium]
MKNAGELTEVVFKEFYSNWDEYFFESEKLLAKKKNTTIEKLNNIDVEGLPKEGRERERLVKVRINQYLFRTLMDANYNAKCCITGIDNPELLIASHIVPWSKDEKNRLNPANGLLLNSLHDKAFERGLITISEDFKVKVSSVLLKSKVESIKQNFSELNNKPILLPRKFKPDIEFLKKHYERFRP